MNERIKQLADQATSYMPGRPPYDGLTFDMFDKEKFAELIVRECAWAADFADKEPGDYILKRFGVKE